MMRASTLTLCAFGLGLTACSAEDGTQGATEPAGSSSATTAGGGTDEDTASGSSAGPTSSSGGEVADASSDSTDATDSGTDTTGPEVPTVDCDDFPSSIDAESLMAHLSELQAIADAHGNRAVGTPGYQASADYVRARLAAAGYASASDQDFEATVFEELSPTVFSSGAPLGETYAVAEDFYTARYSGAGTVTANVVPIAVNLTGDNANNSACVPEHFDGFPAGSIALIQRGDCTFIDKVGHAADAGASAVIIFNQGDTDNRLDAFFAGIDPNSNANPPTLLASYAVGEALALAAEVQVTVDVDAVTEDRSTRNVLVERVGTDPSQVVMFGAHLDSVTAGGGINDNGTGSMAMLAIAERLAQCQPARTVRFAWWGAEEIGLVGSRHYVQNLALPERESMLFYLNFDMIGSPNFVRFVHDGDGSAFGNQGAPGSDALEQFFHDHFEALGLPIAETRFDGRSDYGPFLDAGIPTGGLATGAEGSKSAQQVELYGGVQGEAYDPCYHLACDVDDNVAADEYARITTAVATAVARFGIEGEGLFSTAVQEPPTTVVSDSGPADVGCGHELLSE